MCLSLPFQGEAQVARLQAEENLRAEPNGVVLGRLRPGVELRVEAERGSWVQVTLEAWLWTRSLQTRSQGPYDLVVAADEGENIRSGPSGEILGRFVRGALLQELERQPGWIRFRRTGWIWKPSVEIREAEPAEQDPAQSRWVRSRPGGEAILSAPDGDTLARTEAGAELRIGAQEGNWVRVRLEGWVWMPGAGEGEAGDTAVFSNVTPEELVASPERYTGRLVSMALQYISVERAEKVRTDFYEDEPYILARSLSGERSFVYVTVPPDRVDEVQGITPLDRITVIGRVRTVAAGLTGNPVLDLLDLYRNGGGG